MNAQVVGQRSGTKEPPPLFRSLPPPLSTCLPLYQRSTGSLFTSAAVYIVQRCPDTVCPYLLCPGGSFASVRPHSRADHSLGQEPVYAALTQCAHLYVQDLRRRAQFVRGQKMRNQGTTPESLGQGSFTGQIAGQAASSAEKADGVKIIMFGR